ncbi:glycosyltransferase family 4 protein [Mucilaginibacter lacusdianchii]|uniref:glycosyltransferase family 4 protein n=1 Tax=Mucilaginibacter lacusdianchii TaxID=2684211 RepID=UPI00131D2B9B|nr:glycosyltransferase family 4 protein [Mucilaginibacter sp. JXJ CY 39]
MGKLLVYTTQHLETGGIESHLQEFCKNMAAAGAEIDLVVLNAAMLPETEAMYRKVCRKVYFGRHGRSYKRLAWLIKTGLQVRINRYDALYTNGQGNSPGLFAKLVRSKNWVHHHHTAGDAADQSSWSDDYAKTLKTANHVIACARRNANDMAAFLKRSIDTIPCFSRKVELGSHPVAATGEVNFGYFGRLIPEKGIDLICRLSEEPELKDIRFNIWGEGPKYPSSYFDGFKNVYYHGTYTGKEGLTNAIAKLDAFLLLSTHPEGLPISLLEVMSAGVPWMATNRGGIADIACDPVSTRLLPNVDNYDQVKQAITQLHHDIVAGKVSRETQVELYEQNFSSAALVKQWSNKLF